MRGRNPQRLVQLAEHRQRVAAREYESIDAGSLQGRFDILGPAGQVDELGSCGLERRRGRHAELGVGRVRAADAGNAGPALPIGFANGGRITERRRLDGADTTRREEALKISNLNL